MGNMSFVDHTVKITVVKTLSFNDLAVKYDQIRPGDEVEGESLPSCPFFKEGMEFTVVTDPYANCKPEGFCDWAWADIWKDVLLVADRAGFAPGDDISKLKPHFACCTDGLRPVIFMLEAVK
ncbi:MAG: TIGR04076 family protein [Oscillospiraceae bacterium]|jgi:uncharacterized repeat protein (TIGR04076 family)